ncbi:MAG: hypothetical protein IT200_09950 [Thermoleophilia bacterium]|nr:hypothetical protein [Thermoleophilia bacterium]
MSDEPTTAGDDPGEERMPTPEEVAAQFVHRLGRTPVRDILMQTMATMNDVAGIRMGLGPEGDEVKDMAQARLAIETIRALLQLTEREVGAAAVRPFTEPLAALQMAYAQIAEADRSAGQDVPPPPEPPQPDPASRLWTPPGAR